MIQHAQTKNRHRHVIASMIALLALLLAVAASHAQELTPDPKTLYLLDGTLYSGSGCPPGSVDAIVSEDGLAISIFFDAYRVEVGPDTEPRVRQACDISIPMHIPQGWQYSLVALDYRGYLFLDQNVRASQSSEYDFQALSGPNSLVFLDYRGYLFHAFDATDRVELDRDDWTWSPCQMQRDLHIRTSMSVSNRFNRDGFGRIAGLPSDSMDGAIEHIYAIEWRHCDASLNRHDGQKAQSQISGELSHEELESITGGLFGPLGLDAAAFRSPNERRDQSVIWIGDFNN